ncbi:MAG: SAF domain-containing protein [Pseudonocardiales bacterium]|nr:SAF domain-containing protein [Actinomycetota bacterium]
MTVPSPAPRRIKAPSWLDLRLVVGVVLVLGSVAFGAKVVSGASHTYRMLAVTRDLAAGTLLSRDDVTAVRVQLPEHGHGIYLSSGTDVLGRQLNRSLASGELLPAAALGTAAALTTLTVPFTADNAPVLAAGQRVEIWLSTKTCASVVLLADVTVQDVRVATGGSFSSSGGQNVVVSVAPELAGRVVGALARDGATIRAGILTGPAKPAVNDVLPDLDACPARTGPS